MNIQVSKDVTTHSTREPSTDYKQIRTDIIQHIYSLEQDIKQMKQKKNEIELLLWDNCDHVWTRDSSACFDDIHKYYCTECSLYKDRRLYLYR